MTENTTSDNTKKAIAFLKTLFPGKRVNIVAIDPHSSNVTGITRPIGSEAIANFIDQNNGRRNVYYSVNTPTDDAPDTKLKKEHIKEINAVWIDADPLPYRPSASAVETSSPAKEKEWFKEERKRLHKFAEELAQGDNPPTVITDSGGGIQAFWLLDKPVPCTEDTRREYEALSRGLADQYGTDRVQNIDRIMRLPYTLNIPGKKKKGREKTLARSSRIGQRYSQLTFITPSEAADSENEIDYRALPMRDFDKLKQPLGKELLDKFTKLRARNQKIDDLWTNKIDMKPSRSERDFTMAKELKGEGLSLLETAHILWHFEHGKNKDLTAREIIRCYERSGNDFASGLDDADIERIARQVNPLKAAKEHAEKLINSAAFITLGDATEAGSGVPLYKHFLNQQTVNVLFGPSGSGKSFLTLDMGVHLAAGKDWAGFKCKQKMAVLYICTESGSSFGKRAKAARTRIGVKAGASLKECPFAYYPAHVDLLNNKDHIKLIAKLTDDLEKQSGYKCGLVIVDTLSAAFGGGNENSEDMTKFVNNMAGIKYGKKVAVLVVHHTGKDESAGARGHSSLKGNIDTEIQVRSEKRGEKTYRSFASTKQKDDETGNMKRFGLNIVELAKDEDGDAITTCRVVLETETEFEGMLPSLEEELDKDAFTAYQAIRFYDAAIANPDIKPAFSHTELQAKCVIFTDQMNQNGVFNVGVLGNNISSEWTKQLVQLDVMSLPSKAQMKAFSRALDKLRTKGMVKENRKYQLVSDGVDRMDNEWTDDFVH